MAVEATKLKRKETLNAKPRYRNGQQGSPDDLARHCNIDGRFGSPDTSFATAIRNAFDTELLSRVMVQGCT